MGEIDEAELLSAGQRGAVLDGTASDGQRIVQADAPRRCCHELRDRIDPRGLRLANAVVAGGLDLTGLVVPFPLRFEGCEFDTALVVEGAQLFELSLTGSARLPGLLGNGLRVQRDLHARLADQADAAWPQRAAAALYAAIGYGYRPLRVLWALAVLLLLVVGSLELPASQATLRATNGSGAVYSTSGLLVGSVPAGGPARRTGRLDSCGEGEVRCFSPVLYAIDTVVPLISLDQRATWYPDPHVLAGRLMLWWLNLATLLGWLLSSIFVLSLARLSRST